MQLPSHLKKKAAGKKPGKYSDASVKMLVTALDDIHMIKFKAGWFTMVKYDHQVFEKKNTKLREELEEHAKNNQIEKPVTWLAGLKIENKFKGEVMEKLPENQKPKDQSRMAIKR